MTTTFPGYFAIVDGRLVPDRDPIDFSKAGESPRNPYLKGLGYKISYKIPGATDIEVYSGEEFFPTTLRRKNIKPDINGLVEIEGTAGEDDITGQTAVPNGVFANGVNVYIRIRIFFTLGFRDIIRQIYIQDKPLDIAIIGPGGLPYEAPFAIPINSFSLAIDFMPKWTNEEGVRKYGGAATVQIFDTPGAPSPGPFLTTPIAETAIASVSSISVVNRTSSGSVIPGYEPPPGVPDYSPFFHFITARFRAVAGSATYVDHDLVLFASDDCAGGSGDGYGYDSQGAPGFGKPEEPPPPLRKKPPDKSKKKIKDKEKEEDEEGKAELKPEDGDKFNEKSTSTVIVMYKEEEPGPEDEEKDRARIPDGDRKKIDDLNLFRTDFDGVVPFTKPIWGYAETQETGPDRVSENRVFLYLPEKGPNSLMAIESFDDTDSDALFITMTEDETFSLPDQSKTHRICFYEKPCEPAVKKAIVEVEEELIIIDWDEIEIIPTGETFDGYIQIEDEDGRLSDVIESEITRPAGEIFDLAVDTIFSFSLPPADPVVFVVFADSRSKTSSYTIRVYDSITEGTLLLTAPATHGEDDAFAGGSGLTADELDRSVAFRDSSLSSLLPDLYFFEVVEDRAGEIHVSSARDVISVPIT